MYISESKHNHLIFYRSASKMQQIYVLDYLQRLIIAVSMVGSR